MAAEEAVAEVAHEATTRSLSDFVTPVFKPILEPVLSPIHGAIENLYEPWATAGAIALFIGAMIWVFTLNKDYVNLDAPSKHFYHDLRFWTIASMVPHLIVYFYFT
ncbi:MAG: hypothetical protein HUU46_15045 [Candidatus Hydrogenedentes bacterium]|nr:hypothetical protein [Candidatus Hydrogenedentota bacterium]